MKDFRGREIKVGSLIAYPGRQGSNSWITVARVIKFGTKRESWTDKTIPTLTVQVEKSSDMYIKPKKQSTIYALDRVVVIEEGESK